MRRFGQWVFTIALWVAGLVVMALMVEDVSSLGDLAGAAALQIINPMSLIFVVLYVGIQQTISHRNAKKGGAPKDSPLEGSSKSA